MLFEKAVVLAIGGVMVEVQRWMAKFEEQLTATLQVLTQNALKEYVEDELHVFTVKKIPKTNLKTLEEAVKRNGSLLT